MDMRITKKQLKEMIANSLTNLSGTYENDLGLNEETYQFLYRGIPTHSMLEGIKDILAELEEGGIVLKNDRNTIVNKIIQDIHNIIKDGVGDII